MGSRPTSFFHAQLHSTWASCEGGRGQLREGGGEGIWWYEVKAQIRRRVKVKSGYTNNILYSSTYDTGTVLCTNSIML